MSEPQQYQMRGIRVMPLPPETIRYRAIAFCDHFGLTKKTKKFDHGLERLVEHNITLNPVDDDEWAAMTYNLTIGHCDLPSLTITIPDRIYKLACAGDRDSLSVVFHEIGHLLLMHKADLHFSVGHATREEDSEWQADAFSEFVLEELGFNVTQLTLDLMV